MSDGIDYGSCSDISGDESVGTDLRADHFNPPMAKMWVVWLPSPTSPSWDVL